jgi:hypothetical protein
MKNCVSSQENGVRISVASISKKTCTETGDERNVLICYETGIEFANSKKLSPAGQEPLPLPLQKRPKFQYNVHNNLPLD